MNGSPQKKTAEEPTCGMSLVQGAQGEWLETSSVARGAARDAGRLQAHREDDHRRDAGEARGVSRSLDAPITLRYNIFALRVRKATSAAPEPERVKGLPVSADNNGDELDSTVN